MKQLFRFSQNISLHLGSLSREQALLCLEVKKKVDQLLTTEFSGLKAERIKVLLAVSGGLDSVAMLAIFVALQRVLPLQLNIAHFNHGIREESKKEKIFVKNLASYFEIPFFYQETDTPSYAQKNKIGLEEAGRILRYEFFKEIQNKLDLDLVFVAHHADDLAEDVLMRLIRGAVWPALGGMQEYVAEKKLFRPILFLGKAQLQLFVSELDLPYINDESNSDTQFLRNRVRKEILPLFLQENPEFLVNIKNIHTCAQNDKIFFSQEIQKFWNEHAEQSHQKTSISLFSLQNQTKALRLRVYTYALSFFAFGFSNHHTLERLDVAVMENKGNSVFKFNGGVRAQISNSMLDFYMK